MTTKSENNKLARRSSAGDNLLRLPSKELHKIICRTLEDALDYRNGIKTVGDHYVEGDILISYILEKQDELIPQEEWPNYTDSYKPSELIIKGINPILSQIKKSIKVNRDVKPFVYRGYKGLYDDYVNCSVLLSQTPVDKDTFNFIKGTLDFETISAIRNRIKDIADKAWDKYLLQHPKQAKNKTKEKEVKDAVKPDGPFICIEGSVYEFTESYKTQTEHERALLLKLVDAILYQKVLKVTYQAFHYDHPDDLEFHPHYIRKVGNKLMVYGRSRSIKYHKEDEYTLVNLIVQRVQNIEAYPDKEKKYSSAKSLGLDYNNQLFRNRMTFNAPGYNQEESDCTEVILKVKKTVPTPNMPRKPFDRLKAEPLHHSQTVYDGIPEDDEFGYLRLYVSDYLFIRPILMGWGSDIQVLKPDSLRQVMEREICRMVEMYGIRINTVPIESGQVIDPQSRISDVTVSVGEDGSKSICCKIDGIEQKPKKLFPSDAQLAEDPAQHLAIAARYYEIKV